MRNLVEYPITADEVISTLQVALESYTKRVRTDGIGGIEGVALLMAEQFISRNKAEFDTFSKASMEVVQEVKND